jgi:OOP family OmpA-OmpF porin
MLKLQLSGLLTILSLGLLAACSSTPAYTPAASQVDAIDVTAYAPKVDSFVILLDTSSTMGEDDQDRPKIHSAQDLLATFNSAVPALDFKAGLITFGNSSGSCFGQGIASDVYGLTTYRADGLAEALSSPECVGGITPMSDGVDAASQMLASEKGPAAVFIVSDFKWIDAAAVEASVAQLKSQHGNELCLHTVKIGDNTTGDALISRITGAAGCDSAVSPSDIASAEAMSTYVTDTLMAPLQYEKHTVSATTLFDFNKAVLKEQGKAELHNLGTNIKSQGMSVGDIDIIGHTDSKGSEEYNQKLSVRRALAVKDYLVSEGIDANIVDVIGKGESDPVASNDTEEGRAKNRRVEIHVGTSRPKS